MAIAGEGRNPGKQHLLEVARVASTAGSDALEVVDRVRAAVDQWPRFADEAGLSKARTAEIDQVLNERRPTQTLRIEPSSDLMVSSPKARTRITPQDGGPAPGKAGFRP